MTHDAPPDSKFFVDISNLTHALKLNTEICCWILNIFTCITIVWYRVYECTHNWVSVSIKDHTDLTGTSPYM